VKFLVDTNVVSELIKRLPDPRVARWASINEQDIVTSPIVIGEVRAGILFLPQGKRRDALMEWYVKNVEQIGVVAFDAHSAVLWSELMADMRRRGRIMPIKDSLIAASARQHDLTIATRNVEDFRYAGVRMVDPFSEG
jgi:predicted nucleic acid-binding protein